MAGSGGTFPSRPASGAGEDAAAHPQPGRLPRSRQEPFSPAGRPRPRCCPGLERLRAGARVPNPLPPTGGSGRRGGAAPTQDPQGAGLPAAPETPMRRGRAKLGCGERAHAARSPPAVLPAPPRGWQLSALGVRAPCPPRPRAPPGRLRLPTPQRRKPPQPHRAKGTHGISHAASRAGEPRGLWTEVASRRAPRRQLRSQETRQPSKRWAGRCRAPAEELDSLQLGPRAPTLVPRPSSMH